MNELHIDAATHIAKHCSQKFGSSWTPLVTLRAGDLIECASL